ncbi:RNA polymerase sigma-70 factor [Marinilabiliaceae bacterium JC017]|nr:RNA polymerase sigma-70 factor [Marinilabiliaceae bacterium JC017]
MTVKSHTKKNTFYSANENDALTKQERLPESQGNNYSNSAQDSFWIEQMRNSDPVAFEAFFHFYQGKIHAFFQHSLPATEDTESLVQEVFIKIWLMRTELLPGKSLKSLLFTIAKNEVNDRLRKRLVHQKYLQGVNLRESTEDISLQKQVEYMDLAHFINRLIDKLPEKRKIVFKLSRFEGKTYKQIARELGISENTVDTQIRKALATLQKGLIRFFMLTIMFFL